MPVTRPDYVPIAVQRCRPPAFRYAGVCRSIDERTYMKDFEGKVAVITGAASGIGLPRAERCVRERMKVVLADVD